MLEFIKKHRTWFVLVSSITVFFVIILITALDSRLQITEYTICSGEFTSEFDDMTIMQLSDIHGQISDELYKYVQDNKPSVAVLTGDIIDENTEDMDRVYDFLSMLAADTPTFMVTGNHEQWLDNTDEILQSIAGCGVRIMDGKSAALKYGEDRIYITGIADPSFVDEELAQSALMRQTKLKAKYDGFNILLFHRADMFDSFDGSGYDLILSGHMHGGQVRIPLVGGIASPTGSWMPKYSGGLYELSDGAVGISNRGIANTVRVPRIYNRPQIVEIKLKVES